LKPLTKLLLGLGMPIGIALSFLAPPAKGFQNPDLARMVFFHLPCALVCSAFLLFVAPWMAFKSLRTGERHWDVRAVAAMEIAVVTGILTLLTGMLFAKVQWGAWWNWDPRQTSFLFVMLLTGAYFAIRSAFSDPEKRAGNSAAYAMAALLPGLFLIFVYPRLPIVKTLHPNVVQEGGLDGVYRGTFYLMLLLVGTYCATLYKSRVRLGLLEEAVSNQDAERTDRNRPAATGVVRPVSVPTQD